MCLEAWPIALTGHRLLTNEEMPASLFLLLRMEYARPRTMPNHHGAATCDLGNILGPDRTRPTHQPARDDEVVGARHLDLFPII